MKRVALPSGETVPALGQGTWQLGDDPARRRDEIASLRRGIEWDLLPSYHQRGIPVMAYSPIEQGRLLRHPVLLGVAARHGATPAQVALAWVLRHKRVIAIPKAGTPEHVRENRAALDIQLTNQDLADLNRAFSPPSEPQSLEML